MHIPTPEEIRARREALGLRQTELAARAGISQSMVARIESGSVDPRVSTLRRIIQVLQDASTTRITARGIMHAPVHSVSPDDPVARAIGIMDRFNISQLPVIARGVPVGCISETAIVNAIEEQGVEKSQQRTVRDVLESGFPTVPPEMDLGTVVRILQGNHAVLVVEEGKVTGVITKHDLLSLLSPR